jgi:hypothetical protein
MSRALYTTLIMVALLTGSAFVYAQICPDTPDGYERQTRPPGEPANYPPLAEPACYQRGTAYSANYISCHLCHYQMWKESA